MTIDLKDCLQLMVKHQLSDLHLKAGTTPVVRKNGQLVLLYQDKIHLSNDDINTAIEPFLKPYYKQQLIENRQTDFSCGVKGIGRFRFNVFYQRGTLRIVIRNVPFKLPNYKDLNLPACVQKIVNVDQRGIILVTGATGSGKSSTIVSILNDINSRYSKHIITIEDPIEFLIEDQKSLITQRELGSDYTDYNQALKSTLRQDPDIIFFGELRDYESMETAISAANTGHLVLSTIHTNSAADTIHRVLNMVSHQKKKLFQMELASSLKAIISQRLILKKDKSGRIPAVEILINNTRVRSILEDESKSVSLINKVIEESRDVVGMQSFNQHLIELAEKNLISKKEAIRNSPSPEKLQLHFKGLNQKNENPEQLKIVRGNQFETVVKT